MKRLVFTAIIGVMSLVGMDSEAYVSQSGLACQAGPMTSETALSRDTSLKVANSGAVSCPVGMGLNSATSVSVSMAVLRYIDSDPTNALGCRVSQEFYDGSVAFSSVKSTCATAGGCSPAQVSFVGAGYLSWNSTELSSPLLKYYIDSSYRIGCSFGAGVQEIISYWLQ